ncbi:MAG TPA: hypothetical protein VKU40_12995 [Thermoanaerobaculia bacterium]|nr:hypothetical protein [Thermoanaerobaculia bacterium]
MKPRRRFVVTCLLGAALLLALGTPALAAAPAAGTSPSLVGEFVDWLAGFGERFRWALTPVTATDSAAPDLDPNGVVAEPPVFLLDPDGGQAATGGGGETAPDLDPDG